MKKKNLFMILLALISCLSSQALAGRESGGGDVDVAQFVSLSNILLKDYPWPADQQFLLASALANSKIFSAPVLRDPNTGAEIPNQSQLIAWSSKGVIEIKQASSNAGDASLSKMVAAGEPVAQYLAHELYRASGVLGKDGKSIDDQFQLSIQTYHLDTFPLFLTTNQGPSGINIVNNDLIRQIKSVQPAGHLVYCTDGSSAGAEFVLAETTSDYVLLMKENAFQGQTLGILLRGAGDPDPLDESFSSQSKGSYLQFEAHIPKGAPSDPSSPECQFSATSPDIFDCGLGDLMSAPVLTDGIQTKVMNYHNPILNGALYFSTSHRAIETVNGVTKDSEFSLTLYGDDHPFSKGGYRIDATGMSCAYQ